MLDQDEYKRWRQAADEARRGAEVQTSAGLYNWACFLTEQAAQLAVKGLLHGIGAGAWGHDLVSLGRALSETVGETIPDQIAAALRRLSRHYIPARYPDAHPSGPPGAYYGQEDADQAIEDLQAILRHVDDLWSRLSALVSEAPDEP